MEDSTNETQAIENQPEEAPAAQEEVSESVGKGNSEELEEGELMEEPGSVKKDDDGSALGVSSEGVEESKGEGETPQETTEGTKSPKTKKHSKKEKKKKKKEEIIQTLTKSIFGDSDSEDEEEFGSKKEGGLLDDLVESKPKKAKKPKAERVESERAERQEKPRKRSRAKEREGGTPKRSRVVEEGEQPEESYEEEKPKKELSEFDQMLEKFKKSRSRKRTDKSEMEVESMVEGFILKMDLAAQQDIEANKQRQPALGKLKMLPDVATQLRKKKLQGLFVENSLMTTLQKWLKPLPDGSLPNIKVRQTILEILNEFHEIPTEDLKESGIGKAVMVLWKHSEETASNKRLAKNLIERWSRPIFGISSQYKDLGETEAASVKKRKEAKKESGNQTIDLELELDKKIKATAPKLPESPSFHARIPEKIPFDFKIRPKSNITEADMRKDVKGVRKKLDNAMMKRSRSVPSLKTIRATPMSVEGRNLQY